LNAPRSPLSGGCEVSVGLDHDLEGHLLGSLRANPAVDVLCASDTDVASA
jgi:hypothetical protein